MEGIWLWGCGEEDTSSQTGHIGIAFGNGMNNQKEANFVVSRGWGASCFLRVYVTNSKSWQGTEIQGEAGSAPGLFDKEDYLGGGPHPWERSGEGSCGQAR